MPNPILHPMQAWRVFAAAADARADGEAIAAGLTVQVLPDGVRRYRDPRLDAVAAHRAAQGRTSAPLMDDGLTDADDESAVIAPLPREALADALTAAWSTPTLTAAGWSW
jgi:hypothetical protein